MADMDEVSGTDNITTEIDAEIERSILAHAKTKIQRLEDDLKHTKACCDKMKEERDYFHRKWRAAVAE